MRLVVDASIAVKWLVKEENSHLAFRLFEERHELFAPRLMASEVGNALSRKARMGEIIQDQALELAAGISEIAVIWADDESIIPDAVRLSLDLNHSVYDCVYLALANRINATMITADTRFARAVAGTEYGGSVITLESLILD